MNTEIIALISVGATVVVALGSFMWAIYSSLKGDIKGLRTELKADIAELKDDIKELRTELKGDIAEVKDNVKELRSDVRHLWNKVDYINYGYDFSQPIVPPTGKLRTAPTTRRRKLQPAEG
ncbi:MAG: hypothetical protein LBR50_00820 [Tannerella sp.]|jgi:predicted nuclease with TOPRIM domain|nr:hypothetical protein [Tannerella sp.]